VDSHSSGTNVTVCLKQPTQIAREPRVAALTAAPISIWPCSPVGFSLPRLLPNARCALTAPFHPYLMQPKPRRVWETGGIFSVALSVGSRLPGVTWHVALRSPDFPLSELTKSDCLTDLRRDDNEIKHPCRPKHL
jgi:hypothetical protein